MTRDNATPRPWYYENGDVFDGYGRRVATLCDDMGQPFCTPRRQKRTSSLRSHQDGTVMDDFGKRMVKAINLHDAHRALVEAVREVELAFAGKAEFRDAWYANLCDALHAVEGAEKGGEK